MVFKEIVYVGDVETELGGVGVKFVGGEPTIRYLAQLAANATTPLAAIINADIITGKHLIQVVEIMLQRNVGAATSRRWTFKVGDDYTTAKLMDNGIDIFIAKPTYWRELAKVVPIELKLGHILWDTWTLGWFNTHHLRDFKDFTAYKCIYHPQHDGRKPSDAIVARSPYFKKAGLPSGKL